MTPCSSRTVLFRPMMRGLLMLVVVAAVTGACVARAGATPFSQLIVFGDSLSDTGNVFAATSQARAVDPSAPVIPVPFQHFNAVPPVPPGEPLYFQGRFSNGPNYVDDLAARLGLPATPSLLGGTNFAFGGARVGHPTPPPLVVPSLVEQVGLFLGGLGGQPADPNALYIVFGGANDILLGLVNLVPLTDLPTAVPDLVQIIAVLAQQGAVDFLVPNLPDLGHVPLSSALDAAFPGFAATATALSAQFNQDLAAALDQLDNQLAVRIHRLDLFSLFNTATMNPAQFGFTNVTDACMQPVGDLVRDVAVGGTPCAIQERDEFIFWDSIHPTAAAHAILAEGAVAAVVPSPSTLLLLVTGLLAAVGYRRTAEPPQRRRTKSIAAP